MKRIAVIILLFPWFLFAQSPFQPGYHFGIHGGLNASTIHSDTLSVGTAFYPFIGGNFTQEFTPHFNFLGGLQYSYRGSSNQSTHYFKLRNSYLDIQLLFQFGFWDVFKFEVGGQYAIMLSSKYIYLSKDQASGESDLNTTGFKNKIEPMIGLHLKMIESVDLGVRYSIPYSSLGYSNLQWVLSFNLNKILGVERSRTYRNIAKALIYPLDVKRLIVKRSDMALLEKNLGKFYNLEELDLSNNHLTSLPAEIGTLVNLEKLDISNNKLSNIPDSICLLTNLLSLNASDNVLAKIPENIGDLKKLQYLNFQNNHIKEFPTSFYTLKNLGYLNVLLNPKVLIGSDIKELSGLLELKVDKSAVIPGDISHTNPKLKISFYNPKY